MMDLMHQSVKCSVFSSIVASFSLNFSFFLDDLFITQFHVTLSHVFHLTLSDFIRTAVLCSLPVQ